MVKVTKTQVERYHNLRLRPKHIPFAVAMVESLEVVTIN